MSSPILPYRRFSHTSSLGCWEFLIAPPPPDLVGIVEAFWISRGCVTFLHEAILPQNNVELMFNLQKPFGISNRPPAYRSFRRAWAAGMQQEWLKVTPQYEAAEPSYLLSVRMPPLGAYRVLGMPLGEIARNVYELDDVFGDAVNRVHEQLGDDSDAGRQFGTLCEFVRRRLARSAVRLRPDARLAVETFARTYGMARIEPLCRSLGVSRKHLNELFRAHVGLTPKTYARMFRFRRVIDVIQRGRRPDWTHVAIACGYYDQAHFNREFRAFAGMSPGEFTSAGSADGLTVLVG